jgi:hypothetical protein
MRRTVLLIMLGTGRKETSETWMRMNFENGESESEAEEQPQPRTGMVKAVKKEARPEKSKEIVHIPAIAGAEP